MTLANEENTPDLLALLMTAVGEAMGASQNTPATLRAPGGGDIELHLSDEDAPTQEADSAVDRDGEFPTLKFGFLGAAPVRSRDEDTYQEEAVQTSDDITFTAGTLVYQVTERDIDSVNSLTATVNGSSQALTEDTDFKVHSTAAYTTDDAIKFLDDGTKPDDGTTFTVDYDHRKVFKPVTMRWDLTFRLVLRVPQLANNDRGASQDYPIPARLGISLQDALVRKLGALQGTNLWPTAGQDPQASNPASEEGSFVLHNVQAMGRLPVPDDGSIFEPTVDVRCSRYGVEGGDKVRVAGKTLVTPKGDLDSEAATVTGSTIDA